MSQSSERHVSGSEHIAAQRKRVKNALIPASKNARDAIAGQGEGI